MTNNTKKTENTEVTLDTLKTMTNHNSKDSTFIIQGTVVSAYNGKTKFDDESKNRIAVQVDSDTMEDMRTLYKKWCTDSPMRPKWLDDNEREILNFKSNYDIPTKGTMGGFEEVYPQAKITLRVRFKPMGIYPVAIIVKENGEPVNPFEGME